MNRNLLGIWGALTLLSLFVVYKFANFSMFVATLSYFILCTGLILRKTRKAHATLMSLGISLDLLLVLTLQIKKSAIQTAVAFTLSPLQQAHVGFSTLATVLYFPVLFYGYKRLKNSKNANHRKLHIRMGLMAFIFRTIGFFLMFSLLSRQVANV